jgi:diguanylate cyclase (GGDEF)-like protein/PAS domain S-box-containing protein
MSHPINMSPTDTSGSPGQPHDLRFADFLRDLVACFDPQLRHIYVNSAVEHFTGRRASEFIGKTNQELGMPPEQVAQWNQALMEAFRTGQPSEIRFSFPTPDGQRLFLSQLLPQVGADGSVNSVVTVARDLAVNELGALTLEHFKAIIDSSDDAIVGKTLDGLVTSWNRGAEVMFGYSQVEMIGRSLMLLFPEERKDEERFIVERLLLGEKVQQFETVRIRKDGARVHVSVSISPIRDERGRIIGASKVARNITPLKIEQERLQLALDASCSGLWDWDLRTGQVYRSTRFYQLVGAAAHQDTSDPLFFQRAVFEPDWPRVRQALDAYVAGQNELLEIEFRLAPKHAEIVTWLLVKGRAVEWDATGQPLRIVGTLSDITHSKLAALAMQDREQRLSRVLDGSDQGYWDWNVPSNHLVVSPRWETMLGYQPGEMDVSHGRWAQVVHPDDLPSTMAQVDRHLRGDTALFEHEFRCRTKSGDWRWVLSRGKVVEKDSQGQPLTMSGTHTDISERKQFEASQRQALTVFANSYEGIMVVDAKRRIVDVNPAFARLTGYERHEILGKSPRLLSIELPKGRFFKGISAAIRDTGNWAGEAWSRKKSGEIFAVMLSVAAVLDTDGEVKHFIAIFSDITQLKAHEAELDRVAHYDPLTGVPNRRLLVDRLSQAIARANRRGLSLAVCYLDLDGFKRVNDQHGHAAGDRLLIGVANNLRQVLRADDTLARLGGDEFVLLLSGMESPQHCSQLLERILASVNTALDIGGTRVNVSASIGVSLYPQDDADADTLIRHADQAMYLAKEAGKNRFHLFDPESDRKAQEHRRFVERLNLALDRNEFCLFYQPKIDLTCGAIVGVEALIRWQDPAYGLRSPMEFLPHAQGTKLERLISVWVLHEAMRQMQRWQRLGQEVNISVNVSAGHLQSPEFLDDLRMALISHSDIQASRLELEVLESTAINDISQAAAVLDQCRLIGVRLALDDFGTGYSSLTYLRKLPFDLLKIDQSFVRDMLKDPDDRGIVEGVIRLAAAFDREVIAEGVETMEHGAALLQLGCKLAQGYGIAKPMPA